MSRTTRAFLFLCVVAALIAFAVRRFFEPSAQPAPTAAGVYRIATWNTGWLLDETSEERFRNIRKVIESLRPDVLAMQEIESKSALRRVLPPGYTVAISDDPKEDQELALAVRPPFRIVGEGKVLFASRRYDSAFPGRRNVLEVMVDAPGDHDFYVYVIHYKSRGGGRTESDPARKDASRLLLDHIKKKGTTRFIVLGDFNDTPSDDSVNILETGDPSGSKNDFGGEFLQNPMQTFYQDDYVTQGFFRQYRGGNERPVVRGAQADNDGLRGTYYEFPRGVKVTEALFDQILLTPNIADGIENADIYFGSDALTGPSSRITRDKSGVAVIEKHGTLPSDHLPVYVDINLGGSRPTSAAPRAN